MFNYLPKTNPQLFREKITDFSGLVQYTKKVLNEEIVFIECIEDESFITKDIIYHFCSYDNLFYITENKPVKDREVLFWEKESDKFNLFSSAGKLSRLVRKLFIKTKQTEALVEEKIRFSNKRIQTINQKVANLK